MNPKVKTRADKLLKLMEQGKGGEVANAEARLTTLLQKHGYTLEQFLDTAEKPEMHWYRYDNPYVKDVISQIAYMVLGKGYNCWTNRYKQRQLGFELTPSQKIEMDIYYNVYRQAFKTHLTDSTAAFIKANDIYPSSNIDYDDHEDFAEANFDELMRREQMAAQITPTPVHKPLENKK